MVACSASRRSRVLLVVPVFVILYSIGIGQVSCMCCRKRENGEECLEAPTKRDMGFVNVYSVQYLSHEISTLSRV